MKFQITKDLDVTSNGEVVTRYYVSIVDNEEFSLVRVINVFHTEDEAKEFLEKIKDIYPVPDYKEEVIYDKDHSIVRIVSYNAIDVNKIKPVRNYALFHNSSCIKVEYDDYEKIKAQANKFIETLEKRNSIVPKNEVIYEITINK